MKEPQNHYDAIIEKLYDVYYVNFQDHSEVTSSHWKTIGSQEVHHVDGKFLLKGGGFGNLPQKNLLTSLRNFPEMFLCLKLLKKYKCPKFLQLKGQFVSSGNGSLFLFDCVKQVLSLQWILSKLLKDNIPDSSPFAKIGIKTVCVIGDGYGYMTSLLKTIEQGLKVVCVNLGRTLLFDVFYTQKKFTGDKVGLITDEENKKEKFDKNSILFMEAEKYELLKDLPIDLFINIASMQEMNNKITQNYFQ